MCEHSTNKMCDWRVSGMLILHVLACCVWQAGASCLFPEYVQQSIATPRDWRGKIREQNTEVSLRITFEGSTMRVISTDSFGKSMTRHCRQAYGSNLFLVSHDERNNREGRFTCMEFVRRGNGILQIQEADLSETIDRSLCSDSNLKLDGWLVVDMINAVTNMETCSLRGGFDINVFDKSNFRGVCDAYQGETRLESECLPGEGLTFQFRKSSCVPDGLYMYAEQNTHCLANWAQGKWSFILIKHDKLDYMWVLRYPNNLSVDRFTAHLFKDLYASTEDSPTNTYNYLHMAMIRNKPFDMNSLCMDEYEICTALREPCGINAQMLLTCPMRCGLCNATKPTICNIDRSYRGMWSDAAHFSNRAEVSIDANSLTVQSSETLRCVQWSAASAVRRSGQHTEEMMLVSDSTGGCRPRYSCAKLTRINPAAMFIQISQPRMWPLTKNAKDKIDCSSFSYDSDGLKHKDSNKLREKHQILLIPERYDKKVECDLNRFRRFNVMLRSGTRCAGELRQNTKKNNLHFDLQNCADQTLRHTFDCIEYDRYPPSNDLLLITRTQGSHSEIHCWIFPKRPANIFHLIPASHCNENAKRRIRKGRLRPIATFTKPNPQMRTKSGSMTDFEPTGRINLTMDVPRESPPEVETEPTYTYDVEHNDTMTSQQEVGETSPFVIAAVVVTMMVIQLSLLCACRCT